MSLRSAFLGLLVMGGIVLENQIDDVAAKRTSAESNPDRMTWLKCDTTGLRAGDVPYCPDPTVTIKHPSPAPHSD